MLAYITGTVDQELLLRNEYLAAENRILRAQIKGRLLLSDAEKGTLAEIAHRLRRKAIGGHRTDIFSLLPAQFVTADMVPDNVGMWMFHCHVDEHMEAGMTAIYEVVP
jgi:Multicopper oxidase